MTQNDKRKFRELQLIFFAGVSENPTDTNRLEAGFAILEKFIDSIIERECSALFSKDLQLRSKIKGPQS